MSVGCIFLSRADVVIHGDGALDCVYAGVFPCIPSVVIRPADYAGSWEPTETDPSFTASPPDETGVQVVEGEVRNAPGPLLPGTYRVAGVIGVPDDQLAQPPATPRLWTSSIVGCVADVEVTATTVRVEIRVTYRPDNTCDIATEITDGEALL
jgi:hypothetical protein